MNSWQNHSIDERISMIQSVAQDHNIEDNVIEKDWWAAVVLKALFNTSYGKWLLFKGGTSLSKGWNLISRSGEDIDISIGRNFSGNVLNLPFAKCENNNQVKKLRKASRDYIYGTFSLELDTELLKIGVKGYTIMDETVTGEPPRPIDHDGDLTIIFANYKSILPSGMRLIDAGIKIEISCLSISEPNEECDIHPLVFDKLPEEDDKMTTSIKTAVPSRTFLEKALLLNEELQKEEPKMLRMSRHLYDLDRLMDTEFGQKSLNDDNLYKAIIEHRRRFHHLGYVGYDKDYPASTDFIPRNEILKAYRLDYETNMVDGYIHGEAKPFKESMKRTEKLLHDFRQIIIP